MCKVWPERGAPGGGGGSLSPTRGLLRSLFAAPPTRLHPQVFDNTPAALDGTVAAGDEITGVNGRSIKGKTKVEVAKMIQEVKVRLLWGVGTQAAKPLPRRAACQRAPAGL